MKRRHPKHRQEPNSGAAIRQLLAVMARLRSPTGCPWDREQDHQTLRFHAVEEVYELIDAIEARDDREMAEELGDLLLQVVFHCQLARERKAFDFDQVVRRLTEKLVRRHPHVFGQTKVKNVDEVWANWEKIKRAEKDGTTAARRSALDGIPKHLPALLRAEKLVKKARKAGLLPRSGSSGGDGSPSRPGSPRAAGRASGRGIQAPAPANKTVLTKKALAAELFDLARQAQAQGWSAEALLRAESQTRERAWRRHESARKQLPPTGLV